MFLTYLSKQLAGSTDNQSDLGLELVYIAVALKHLHVRNGGIIAGLAHLT